MHTLTKLSWIGLATLALDPPAIAIGVPLWQQPDYVAAIVAARGGRPEAALALIATAQQRGPLSSPLFNDYLVLLCWSGDGARALALAGQPPAGTTLRGDTLRTLAAAARDRRDVAAAQNYYRQALQQAPDAATASALAMVQAEAGNPSTALATLDAAVPATGRDRLELIRARAYVLQLGADRARALDYVRAALELHPGDPVLTERYRDLLVRLGLPSAPGGAVPDAERVYRLAGVERAGGGAEGALGQEGYRRDMPPTALFNDYLLLLAGQGQLDRAVRLADGRPDLIDPVTRARLRRQADRQGDRAALQRIDRWPGAAVAGPTPASEDRPLPGTAEAAALLDAGEPARALARLQSLPAGDPRVAAVAQRARRALGLTPAMIDPAQDEPAPDDRLLHADRLGNWGRIDSALEPGRQRFARTERALAMNAGLAGAGRDAVLDQRIQLLQARGRAAEAVALYRQTPPDTLSADGYAALGAAFLALRTPQPAVDAYRQALQAATPAQQDTMLEWRIGLLYALMEAGHYRDCRRALADLVAATPRERIDPLTGQRGINPDYQTVGYHRAMLAAYLEDTPSAERQLDALLDDAPFAPQLRLGQGALQLLRGQPRTADDGFRRLSLDSAPESVPEAELGRGDAALALYEFDQAAGWFDQVAQQWPEQEGLDERRQQLVWARRPQLEMETGHDLGGNQGAPQHDAWDASARLYSAASGHWRGFALYQMQHANFDDRQPGAARFDNLGMGAQYRSRFGSGEFGLTSRVDGSRRAGGFAGYDWTPDDRWTLGLRAEGDSAEVPLQARLDGVHGDQYRATLQYRVDDWRQFSLQAGVLDLSDGNRRRSQAFVWSERWLAGPIYRLDTETGVAASANQPLPTAGYFNPQRDLEVSLTQWHDWTLWRQYDNDWHQRVGLETGRYRQTGQAARIWWGVTLEQVWDWQGGYQLRYGVTRTRHPYDGVDDFSNHVYLNLDWRF